VGIDVPDAWKGAVDGERVEILPLVDDLERNYRSGWCTYAYEHEQAPELEVMCGGVNTKTPRAAALWRQGNLLHFGFEQWIESPTDTTLSYLTYGPNTQYGIRTLAQHQDLSSNPNIVGTYNFPGGALGSLVSGSFSLAGSVAEDRPTLYFNYFLDTENHAGSNIQSDVNDPFRDSARVYASRNGGQTWELVATNNSRLSGGNRNNADQHAALSVAGGSRPRDPFPDGARRCRGLCPARCDDHRNAPVGLTAVVTGTISCFGLK
jgi:hypothetical protein